MFIPKALLLSILFACTGVNLNHSRAQAETNLANLAPALNRSGAKLAELGQQHFDAGEYQLAIQSYLELLKIEPDNVQAYNTIGMSMGELKKYSPAIAAFERAIALDRDFANAYYNRGYIYQQLGKYDLALTDFDLALELTAARHVSALINRASIHAFQENYQLALIDLKQAIKLNPKLATAYYNRALVNLTIGNQTAYLNDLTTAEQLYRQQGDTSGLAQVEQIKKLY